MDTVAPYYNNTHLLVAGLLTAFQLFIVAAFFNQLSGTYSVIIVLNSVTLPLIMAYKSPRKIGNLISLFSTLFVIGFAGFILSWLVTLILPRSYIENNPFVLDTLSKVVAFSASLPPSILPFSFSLIMLLVFFGEKEQS